MKHRTAADEGHWSNQLQNLSEMINQFNSMDPQQRRRHTLDAVKRLVIRESERQPLLVVFEDLHWVDSETHAFLDSLVDGLPMTQILVLVNYRPGFAHAWNNKSYLLATTRRSVAADQRAGVVTTPSRTR